MKKVLVTGGAGYIGSHTVVELINSGFDPIIVDNYSNSDPKVIERLKKLCETDITTYKIDCNDKQAFSKVFEDHTINGIIHFAANKAVGESVRDPLKYYRNNVGSLVVLLELMEEYKVRDLIFSSSCTVYGQPDQLPVTEESPVKNAESPYGFTKQICERMITDLVGSESEVKSCILRYFNPIGAHPSSAIGELPLGKPENLIPFVTQTAIGIREQLTVFGDDYNTPDGSCIRDYIHVVDLAKAHVKSLEWLFSRGENGFYDIFNVGTGKGDSVLEVVEAFQKVNDVPLNYQIGPKRPGDVEQIYATVDKANKILGWSAELSLEDALRDAWNWQKSLEDK